MSRTDAYEGPAYEAPEPDVTPENRAYAGPPAVDMVAVADIIGAPNAQTAYAGPPFGVEPDIVGPSREDEEVPPTGVTAGTPGSFTPEGCTVPANITELRALGLSPGAAWTTGQYVVIGTGNAHWMGTDWAMGVAP